MSFQSVRGKCFAVAGLWRKKMQLTSQGEITFFMKQKAECNRWIPKCNLLRHFLLIFLGRRLVFLKNKNHLSHCNGIGMQLFSHGGAGRYHSSCKRRSESLGSH